MSAEDVEVGRRSSSPPGRESREDWKGGQRNNTDEASLASSSKADKERSRSRSPRDNSSAFKGKRETREQRFIREGTNTNSREPHLQRARLFVGNIEPDKTHRKDLIELFSRYGEVLGVSVHKGYAFVQMDRERNANRAVNGEDNRNFMGSRIRKLSNPLSCSYTPKNKATSFVNALILFSITETIFFCHNPLIIIYHFVTSFDRCGVLPGST